MAVRVLPMSPTAVLVEDLPVRPAAFAGAVRRRHARIVVDVVPGAATVLISVSSPDRLDDVVAGLDDIVTGADVELASVSPVEIPVRYDGPDLPEVATAAGLTVDQVIDLHCSATYRVDFCGFAPGFGYLSGLPEQLWLPRRATPRTSVPAGSVAIAASYTAVYPTASPGGWHLIATTEVTMFDADRSPPALFVPGAEVRFIRMEGA